MKLYLFFSLYFTHQALLSPMSPGRITAYLYNHCPVCTTDLSLPKNLINHLRTQHHIVLSPRKKSLNRPRDPAYDFSKDMADCQLERFACPSCWSHFSEPHELEQHFQEHINNKSDNSGSEENQRRAAHEGHDDEEEEASSNNLRGRKGASEDENDAEYLKKSNELFNTLDDLIAGFKKLLPYSYTNEKNGSK